MEVCSNFSFKFSVKSTSYILSTDSFFDDLKKSVGRKVGCLLRNDHIQLLNFGGAVNHTDAISDMKKVKVKGCIGFSPRQHEYQGFYPVIGNYILGIYHEGSVFIVLKNKEPITFN